MLTVADPRGNVTRSTYDLDDRIASTETGANGPSPSTVRATDTTWCPEPAPARPSPAPPIARRRQIPTAPATVDYFDVRDNEMKNTTPGGSSTEYSYDVAGNKVTLFAASGNDTVLCLRRGHSTYGDDLPTRTVSHQTSPTPMTRMGVARR